MQSEKHCEFCVPRVRVERPPTTRRPPERPKCTRNVGAGVVLILKTLMSKKNQVMERIFTAEIFFFNGKNYAFGFKLCFKYGGHS